MSRFKDMLKGQLSGYLKGRLLGLLLSAIGLIAAAILFFASRAFR